MTVPRPTSTLWSTTPKSPQSSTRSLLIFSCLRSYQTMASPIASSSSHTLDDEYIDHLLILYASETGASQDTAERVGREVRRRGRRCVVQSMDRYDVVRSPSSLLAGIWKCMTTNTNLADGAATRASGGLHYLNSRPRRPTTDNASPLDCSLTKVPTARHLGR